MCDVRGSKWGAKGDNSTDDSTAIQQAIYDCRGMYPTGAVVVLSGPATYRINVSIALTSNITLLLQANTSLFSAQPICNPHTNPQDCAPQNPHCPTLYWKNGPTGILCGTNLTNVAVVGEDQHSSVLDGGGWPWYEAGAENPAMNGQGPRFYELTWSKNLTLSQVTFKNSPSWTVHPTFCDGILAEHIQVSTDNLKSNPLVM